MDRVIDLLVKVNTKINMTRKDADKGGCQAV
jgi:hypothetical protein